MTNKVLSNCQHLPIFNNCKKCAIFLHDNNCALKSEAYDCLLYCSSSKYLKNIRKNKCQTMPTMKFNLESLNLISSLSARFQFSIETQVLALYIFARMIQRVHKQPKNQELIACSSLIVACKAIELDKNIPLFIYFTQHCKEQIQDEDFIHTQKQILEEFRFDFQHSTFITFVNFYLTNGVVFKSDGLSPQKIFEIQTLIMEKSHKVIDNGSFLAHNPEKLALSIIKEARIDHQLPPWNKQLEKMTGFQAASFSITDEDSSLTPLNYMIFRKKCNNNNSKIISRKSQEKMNEKVQKKHDDQCHRMFRKENSKLAAMKNRPTLKKYIQKSKQRKPIMFTISLPKYIKTQHLNDPNLIYIHNKKEDNENEKGKFQISLRKNMSKQKLAPIHLRK